MQPSPDGLAQAFIIGEEFIGDDDICLILGDNALFGDGLPKRLRTSVLDVKTNKNAIVFGYYVNDPDKVAEFDNNGKVISLMKSLKIQRVIMQCQDYIFILTM